MKSHYPSFLGTSSFPKTKQFLGVFNVIQGKIMQIGKTKHFMRIWEDNEWRFKRPLKISQKGEIMFQVPTCSMEKSTPKDEETNDYARIKHSCTPGGQKNTCAPPSVNQATSYAQKYTYAPSGVVCTPPSVLFLETTAFCYFLLLWKTPFFQPKPSWNQVYKFNSSHSQLFI